MMKSTIPSYYKPVDYAPFSICYQAIPINDHEILALTKTDGNTDKHDKMITIHKYNANKEWIKIMEFPYDPLI